MTGAGLREGRAAARRATRAHDENFPVAFALAPRDVRADMRVVYAFCRATDDLGDEGPGGPADRLAALDAWEEELDRAAAGAGADARLVALADTIARRGMDLDPFRRLIEANRMDQRRSRWDTHDELLHYCRHSATSVGEMVLGVLGYRDPWRDGMSDATCIGLQLVNFWQDIRRDLRDRDRIYLPREDMARLGVTEDDLRRRGRGAGGARAGRARGGARARLPGARGRRSTGSCRGASRSTCGSSAPAGLALCDAIARQDHDTLARRPAPGRPRPGAHRRRGRAARGAWAAVTLAEAHERLPRRRPGAGAQLLLRLRPAAARASAAGIYAAYAFSRRADDRVDEEELDGPSGWRRWPRGATRWSAVAGATPPADDAVLVALADTIRRFAIPRGHLDALLDGVEMDLTVCALPRLRGAEASTATASRERWGW